jgi:hypothetical protein
MLKERLAIAKKLATEVHEAETAIDQAIAKVGVLMTSLPQAQAQARLSSVASDAVFGHMSAAVAGLLGGRTNMVAVHKELSVMKDKVGLRNVIVGMGDAAKLVPQSASIADADAPAAIQAKVA